VSGEWQRQRGSKEEGRAGVGTEWSAMSELSSESGAMTRQSRAGRAANNRREGRDEKGGRVGNTPKT